MPETSEETRSWFYRSVFTCVYLACLVSTSIQPNGKDVVIYFTEKG